ncbi:HNH endonuclease [Bacillus pseudomycoides]|uniref:HNH endonuclease n=1 Tax=Bacillus pseudomycoides TaxID=64104 RepID=UPI00211D21AD|nr:HNH endonuclease [Bacillus pseudomycoides]
MIIRLFQIGWIKNREIRKWPDGIILSEKMAEGVDYVTATLKGVEAAKDGTLIGKQAGPGKVTEWVNTRHAESSKFMDGKIQGVEASLATRIGNGSGLGKEAGADLAKASGKDYPRVELDEVIAKGYDEAGKLKERWVVPKGYKSVDEFLQTVDDVTIKEFGYDSVEEFKEVVRLTNTHLNASPRSNIVNKPLAGGTHVKKGVDFDILGFPIFKGDDVKFTTKLREDLLIAKDDQQFKNCTNALS